MRSGRPPGLVQLRFGRKASRLFRNWQSPAVVNPPWRDRKARSDSSMTSPVDLSKELAEHVKASEKRQRNRHRRFHTEDLTIEIPPSATSGVFLRGNQRETKPQVVSVHLIDVSADGLGLRTYFSLPVGKLVTVRGDLHSVDSCLAFQATSRVAHCSDREDGSYLLGLSFAEEEVEYEVLPCDHEPGFSLSLDSE